MAESKDRQPRKQSPSRADKTAETRSAIVTAALMEFLERGFAGARLDEISKRAGVAKGTIYIHFKDKEALFEGIVRHLILPYAEQMEEQAQARPLRSLEEFFEEVLVPFVRGVQKDQRVDIIRLHISEGPRFPALSEIYHRVLVEPTLEKLRVLLAATVKPEARDLVEFPQLLMSPMLTGLLWNSLYGFAPMDVEKMMRTHIRLLSVWLEDPRPEAPEA